MSKLESLHSFFALCDSENFSGKVQFAWLESEWLGGLCDEGGTMLKEGQVAPLFALPDADMQSVDVAAFRGKNNVILFFYPKDGTPGCTLEATDFSDHEEEFLSRDCVVIGISRDDCLKHAEFRDNHGISVCLLSDADGVVCKKYGVWQAKEVDGVKRFGIARSTFVIDKQGVLRLVMYGVNAKGHALDVLRLVKELNL